MNKKLPLALLLIILISFSVSSSTAQKAKVDVQVHKALEESEEVPVIIKSKDSEITTTTLTEKQIREFESSNEIEKIEFVPEIRASLLDSTKIINATNVWSIQINSKNITGIDETICVIDTGIDFSHPDLKGKNKTCIVDCYNKACVEDCSIFDDNGHGTHVSGIIAASGVVTGVAPEASLIGVKVLDSEGGAHPQTGLIDLNNAINWCIDNKNVYNISVISMSLGTVNLFDDYCDASFSLTLTPTIDTAAKKNITVIASTGNSASATSISAPACIKNTIAVGGTDKSDSMYSDGNYNSITDLLAPGVEIISTVPGGYTPATGTSMSTPHVSGAIALLNQFNKLYSNSIKTPQEMQTILKNNGKNITTPEGFNFTRIDIYKAINSLNFIEKNLTLNTILLLPNDNSFTNINETNFSCQSTSEPLYALTNVTFHLWNSTKLIFNQTKNISGFNATTTFPFILPYQETFHWNCLAFNNKTNSSDGEENFTLTYDLTKPNVTLISPEDNFTGTENTLIEYSFDVADNFNISHCNLITNNQSVSNLVNISINNTNVISHSLQSGVHQWQISCTDLAKNIGNSESRSMIIHSPPQSSSGGGGGGGGSSGGSGGRNQGITFTIINNTNTTQTVNSPTTLDQEELKDKSKDETGEITNPTITTHAINEPSSDIFLKTEKGIIALLIILSFLITVLTRKLSKRSLN